MSYEFANQDLRLNQIPDLPENKKPPRRNEGVYNQNLFTYEKYNLS